MVVPVSLRPDRRGQVWTQQRGWVDYRETRAYREEQRRLEAEHQQALRVAEEERKRNVELGFKQLFAE